MQINVLKYYQWPTIKMHGGRGFAIVLLNAKAGTVFEGPIIEPALEFIISYASWVTSFIVLK